MIDPVMTCKVKRLIGHDDDSHDMMMFLSMKRFQRSNDSNMCS